MTLPKRTMMMKEKKRKTLTTGDELTAVR